MISVLIPAYNEKERIAATVVAARQAPGVHQVVVVDDGSTDETASLADGAGARVLRLPYNMGKGAALNRGVAELTGPYITLLDAELGESAGQLEILAEPVLAGIAELAIAALPPAKKAGGFGLVKGLSRWGIFLATGLWLAAPLSGQRVMTRQALEKLLPFADGYGVEVAMTIVAARAGLRILEVPTSMTHRSTGRSRDGFTHRGRQLLEIARALKRMHRQE